jgi:hypothetical protein
MVEIVLGVSMTPTTVRMVLVEGEKADGVIVDHDVFDITAVEGSATPSASEQVIAAILGTRESALAAGHHLVSTGVSWGDHTAAADLREGLADRGIDDAVLVSELHAAAGLAQAAGRAVGYHRTALLFIDQDTATMSVVETADGSVVKTLRQSLHSADAMADLAEMVTTLEQNGPRRPQSVFVVGSGVEVGAVKTHLQDLTSLTVIAPAEPALALARGAALASANTPEFEESTVGLAYSQAPEGAAVAPPLQAGDYAEPGGKPFLLVGSSLATIFLVGVMALVISLAVSVRPTADQRSGPNDPAARPGAIAAAPPAQALVPTAAPQPQPAAPQQPAPPSVVKAPPAPAAVSHVSRPAIRQKPSPAPVAVPPAAPPAVPLDPPAPPPPVAPPFTSLWPVFQQPRYQQSPSWYPESPYGRGPYGGRRSWGWPGW